MLDLVDEASKT